MSIRDDLKAYVDGELSPERAAEVRAAVEADPALLQEVEFMKALGFEIKRLSVEPQPQGYEATLKAIGKRKPVWWSPLNLSVAAVAVLFVVGGAAVIWPVFAQSKEAAKRTASLSRQRQFADQTLQSPVANSSEKMVAKGRFGDGDSVAASPMQESPGMAGGAGEPSINPEFGGKRDVSSYGRTNNRGESKDEVEAKPVAPPASLPSTSSRMVVQNAHIDVQVPDAKRALSEATGMAQGLGGFVESSGMSGYQGGLPSASVTLRIPQTKFSVAMERLRGMGQVLSESSSGEDVTAQYADVDARLKVLRQEEEQYRTILGQTKKISEVLEVKDRLGQVRQEIESLDAQRATLKDQARLSTIQATFQQAEVIGQPEQPKNWLEDVWAKAINGLSAVGVFLAKVGVFLFVFSPVWLPVVLGVWWLKVRAAKKG